jgi:regulator of replication initiation timing
LTDPNKYRFLLDDLDSIESRLNELVGRNSVLEKKNRELIEQSSRLSEENTELRKRVAILEEELGNPGSTEGFQESFSDKEREQLKSKIIHLINRIDEHLERSST